MRGGHSLFRDSFQHKGAYKDGLTSLPGSLFSTEEVYRQ